MADFSVPEFRPFRSQNLEARLRHIEDQLSLMSMVGDRDSGLAGATGDVVVVTGAGGNIPEEDVDFDASAGHDHDGEESALIAGVQVEIDFGSIPTRYKTATITDSLVAPGQYILMNQAADAASGRSQDENEMDPILARAVAGTGQFTAYLTALEGPVVGLYRFNYRLMQLHTAST
jgi:hypothetical protein